jgi:hypothetical protein
VLLICTADGCQPHADGGSGLCSSQAADIGDPAVAGAYCDFETTAAPRTAIDEISAAAIPPADIAKATVAQQPFTFGTTDPATTTEIQADPKVYIYLGVGFGRHADRRYRQADQKTQGCHQYS